MVAMSGGVDSSVAAALLTRAGHDVVGVTMRLWGGESDTGCCSVADVEDARRVAQQLGIDHVVFNFTDDFDAGVVQPYVAAHAAGTTPNPCVECNRRVKFARLADRAAVLGFDAVATGHHARIGRRDGRLTLERGVDRDQGPELRRAHARAGGSRHHAAPGRRLREGRRAPARRRARPAHGGQARQPGRVLHHVDGGPPGVPRPPAAAAPGPGRRHRRRRGRHAARDRAGHRRPTQGSRPGRRRPEAVRPRRRPGDRHGHRRLGRRAPRRERSASTARRGWTEPSPAPCSCSAAPTARRSRRRSRWSMLRSTSSWDRPQRRVAPGQSVVFYDRTDRYVLGGGICA